VSLLVRSGCAELKEAKLADIVRAHPDRGLELQLLMERLCVHHHVCFTANDGVHIKFLGRTDGLLNEPQSKGEAVTVSTEPTTTRVLLPFRVQFHSQSGSMQRGTFTRIVSCWAIQAPAGGREQGFTLKCCDPEVPTITRSGLFGVFSLPEGPLCSFVRHHCRTGRA
jgi:hypothetical protein